MDKIKNLSIRKTIVLYFSVSLVIGFLSGALISGQADRAQQLIWRKYWDGDGKTENENERRSRVSYESIVPRVSSRDMSKFDDFLTETCDFLVTYAILVTSLTGMILAVFLFYRNKIREPLAEMAAASRRIADNELDFHMAYSNRDELGQLCAEFEKMRAQLEKNQKEMWRIVEEEKALRAAVAHDIRAPLAVLKGYQEMLLEGIADGPLDREATAEILQEEMGQIERLTRFVETMRRLSGLEKREVQYAYTTLTALEKQIETGARILGREAQKSVRVSRPAAESGFWADAAMVLEVTENLTANAIRYAKREVRIDISLKEDMLEIMVTDDGTGFTAAPEQVTRAFYHSNPRDDLSHFGLGMYISRLYCEKHGGRLLAGNREEGGAAVRALFRVSAGR